MPDDDVEFALGDRVEILDGAFKGFPGTIEDVDNDTRSAVVRVDVFDRAINIEIYMTDLKKLSQ